MKVFEQPYFGLASQGRTEGFHSQGLRPPVIEGNYDVGEASRNGCSIRQLGRQIGTLNYVRAPFEKEPDLKATSVNYDLAALLAPSQEPA